MFERPNLFKKKEGKRDLKGFQVVEGDEETGDALPPLGAEDKDTMEWLRKHEKGGDKMN